MHAEIREAEDDDSDHILRLFKLMQEEERYYDPLLKSGDDCEGSLKNYVNSCIRGMKKGTKLLLVAESEDGKIIGVVSGRVITYAGIYRREKVLYVDNIYVVEEWRSKGVGSALLSAAEKKAHEMDIKIVELDAYVGNHNSIRFYVKRKYRPIYTRLRKTLDNHAEK